MAGKQHQDVRSFAPQPFREGRPRRSFRRGREFPRGVVWFGVRSFWGHLRHLIASAIATENIDSRMWMTGDNPVKLVERVARRLGATEPRATLCESIGRDVWIDYLADTGDDVTVSRAVARLVFTPYALPDPTAPHQRLRAPRGDILFFGGDTAYPVATAEEITARVTIPFNQVLEQRDDGRSRVLLGIPGNHDWYDGLDGFGRMFRRHPEDPNPSATPDLGERATLMGRAATWAREFVRGGQVDKPTALELFGYGPVQSASYFVLPLAPRVTLLALDRQLKRIDLRQQDYFAWYLHRHPTLTPWVALPDPVYAFGKPSRTGIEMIRALGLTPERRPHLILAGDLHHYRREQHGPSLHVTAGGGGAFLHPAPLHPGSVAPEAEWPSAPQSRTLLWQVPWKIAFGRSGVLPHLVLAFLYGPLLYQAANAAPWQPEAYVSTAGSALVLAFVYALIGGGLRHRAAWLALAAGIVTAAVGLAAALVARSFANASPWPLPSWAFATGLLALTLPLGALTFGTYLALLTKFGLENTQAFTALDHPGFKHFLRLRVRADGSAIDAWCIGLVDPLDEACEPVLVDRFTWTIP